MSHIYEYLCTACQHEFFVVGDKLPKPTPKCPNGGSSKIFQKVENLSHKKSDDEREK